jgi:hypothetical protein
MLLPLMQHGVKISELSMNGAVDPDPSQQINTHAHKGLYRDHFDSMHESHFLCPSARCYGRTQVTHTRHKNVPQRYQINR